MKTKIVLEIENEHEAARLLALIDDGFALLERQQRTQRGIDGYTDGDLRMWKTEIGKRTNIRCQFV